jgi:hypothetical protein
MTLLNLLPHRAWALARRRQAVLRELGAAATVAACMGLGAGLLWPDGAPVPQPEGAASLPAPVGGRWPPPAPRASTAAAAPQPSAVLHTVSQALPPQVALTGLSWEGVQLTLHGEAASTEDAHAFLHALRQRAPLLHAVHWVSLQAIEARTVNDPTLQFVLKAQVTHTVAGLTAADAPSATRTPLGLGERGGP